MLTELGSDKPPNYRVVMIGNSHVGKTSIIQRLIFNEFHPSNVQTVGAAFFMHTTEIDGNQISLQIWDTAGQERYKSIGPIYYRNSGAAIVVYDQTDKKSFECVPNWIVAFREAALPNGHIYVVGNKRDRGEDATVSDEYASNFCKEKGYTFYSVSALTGENVEQLFNKVAMDFVQNDHDNMLQMQSNSEISTNDSRKLSCC